MSWFIEQIQQETHCLELHLKLFLQLWHVKDSASGVHLIKITTTTKVTLHCHQACKSTIGTPRLMHILRSSPCHGHPRLEIYDELLRAGFERILNVSLIDE